MLTRSTPILVGALILAGAAGRYACLDDFVGATIAGVASLVAAFFALWSAKQSTA